jgi:hypothetical protein
VRIRAITRKGDGVKDTVQELRRRAKDEVAAEDSISIHEAKENLVRAWDALSAYFRRNPLPENAMSDYSMALHAIEQAIGHMDRG